MISFYLLVFDIRAMANFSTSREKERDFLHLCDIYIVREPEKCENRKMFEIKIKGISYISSLISGKDLVLSLTLSIRELSTSIFYGKYNQHKKCPHQKMCFNEKNLREKSISQTSKDQPKASKTGLVCTIWSSSVAFFFLSDLSSVFFLE